jgi:hypothetical protein
LGATPFRIGILGFLLAFSWTYGLVRHRYSGDWTGPFLVGTQLLVPDPVARPVKQQLGTGFDGQFYLFLASDPLVLDASTERAIDYPRYRSRRILVPLLAWLMAFGQAKFVPISYALLIAFFAGIGSASLAQLISHQQLANMSDMAAFGGKGPLLGLLFITIPAVLISLERMTIDVALVALLASHAAFPRYRIVTLLLAPLVRDTGFLLLAAEFFFTRKWRVFLTAIPALSWWIFLEFHLRPGSWDTWGPPFFGWWHRLTTHVTYPESVKFSTAVQALDVLALLSFPVAIALLVRVILTKFRQRQMPPQEILVASFCSLLAIFIGNPDTWQEAYGFARTLAPISLGLLLYGIQIKQRILFVPMLLLSLRVWWQAAAQFL